MSVQLGSGEKIMIYTFTAAAAYAEAAAAYATAAAAYADMVKIRLSTALALFSWGLAELGNKKNIKLKLYIYQVSLKLIIYSILTHLNTKHKTRIFWKLKALYKMVSVEK